MSKVFQDLTTDIKKLVQIEFTNPKSKNVKKELGCSFCSLDKDKNVRQKIRGLKRIKQNKIMVWFQSPGKQENEQGLELVGPAGKWVWDEFAKLGISRKDVDIQNVVRCATLEEDEETGYLKDRAPTNQEVKCCSIYNGQALELNGGKAKIHLVFGQVAGKALLGKEYKKDNPIFFSEKLKARVVCLDHPSYFLHGAPRSRLDQFRDRLKFAVESVHTSGKFDVLKKYDYGVLTRLKEIKEYLIYISKFAVKKKRAVTVDIEYGWCYKDYGADKLRRKEVCAETAGAIKKMLMIGFCHAPGSARSILLDHPDNTISEKEKRRIKKALKVFLESKLVEKVMHYGSSDFESTEELLNTKIKNYWFDTNYSTYLLWPHLRKFGLDALSREYLPEFSGYKDIIKPYLVKDKSNLATVPIKILTRYNCGDCDVTKRLEILTRKPLLKRDPNSKPLLRVYKDVAFTLRDMKERGPYYDGEYAERLRKIVKARAKKKLKKLRRFAKDDDFNPGSHIQVKKVLYKDLKLPVITVKRVTGGSAENTLKVLEAQTKHPFIKNLLDYRGWMVMLNTNLSGYSESAATHHGRLCTIFWLTGAITGRLRSGGKEEEGIVNLQNIPKDPVIKNILVSDPKWRKIKRYYATKQYSKIRKRKVWIVADYSAIELRVFAEIAEPKFVPIFKSGKDIHGLMGSGFTDWTYEQIVEDEEIRTKVKNINFGIPYGLGKQSFFESLIARGTKIKRKESDKLFDDYYEEYDGIVRFQAEAAKEAEEIAHVKTMFGFWRPINVTGDEIRSTFWKNQAINSKVQGTAHQFLLMAMALLRTHKKRFNLLQEASLEIHDALAFFCAVEDMAKCQAQLRDLLVVAVPEYIKKHFKYKLKIPLECSVKAGFRLGTTIKYNGEDYIKEFIPKWLEENKKINEIVTKEWGVAA
jgi:uracil-DNA glycosylase family 4